MDVSLNIGHDFFILLHFEGLSHNPVTFHSTSRHVSFDSCNLCRHLTDTASVHEQKPVNQFDTSPERHCIDQCFTDSGLRIAAGLHL